MYTSWLISKVIFTRIIFFLQKLKEKVGYMILGPYKTYFSADSVKNEDENYWL